MTPEQALWAPPVKTAVVDWARQNINIPVGVRQGPYDPALAPYGSEILEVLGDSDTTEVVLLKSVQSSGSTLAHIAMAYWLDVDPSDILVVYPSEPTARDQLANRVLPTLINSPRLSQLMAPSGTTKAQISLITGRISAAWSGSPSSLAANPYRRVICDEVDKYVAWRAVEADAISLSRDRTVTYGSRAKVVLISTPTTKSGPIYRAWQEASDRRRWWVSCPSCQVMQLFAWPRLSWTRKDELEGAEPEEKRRAADDLDRGVLEVWWECVSCQARVPASGARDLISGGRWVSEGASPTDPRAPSPVVAYHIWAGMSLFVSWNYLVSQYLRALAAGGGTWQNFVNSFLGEPYQPATTEIRAEIFRAKGRDRPAGICPTWARQVIATADPQHSRIWWMVRAWGPDYQSRLLRFGVSGSYEELRRAVFLDWPAENGGPSLPTAVLLIDAGGSTRVDGELVPKSDETLRFAATDPMRIVPILGLRYRRQGDPRIRRSGSPKAASYGVVTRMVDTVHYKDLLAYRLTTPNDREPRELWQENDSISGEYIRHMTAEERIINRRGEFVWALKNRAARNDLWDCAVYQCAAADLLEVGLETPPPVQAEAPIETLKDEEEEWWITSQSSNWI